MSVLTRNIIVREPIPIAKDSNRPYKTNTIYIQGKGLFQKDLPKRLLYGNRNGRASDKYAAPVVEQDEQPIPFRPVTELSRGQKFALEFYQGKDLYERRKAFADNLSSSGSGGGGAPGSYGFLGNRQIYGAPRSTDSSSQTFYEPDASAIAPEFQDAERGRARSTSTTQSSPGRIVHLDPEIQAANPDLPFESVSSQVLPRSVGSAVPPGLRATQRIVPLSTQTTMEYTATDGSTNERLSSDEPADVLRQNIPPRLQSLRPPVPIPSYAAPLVPLHKPHEGIDPEEANRQVGEYLQYHPDAQPHPNLMPFPTVSYTQRVQPSSELPTGLRRDRDLPIPWRSTLETALDEDRALAEVNIALQNMTLNAPPAATPSPRVRPRTATSNLSRVTMPGAFPATTRFVAPSNGLSRNPQATEFSLATPRHQQPTPYVAPRVRPVSEPPLSADTIGPGEEDIIPERYQPPHARTRGVPALLQRRSRRNVQAPERLTYDTLGPDEPRRSTRNTRRPDRTTYDVLGNPTSRR